MNDVLVGPHARFQRGLGAVLFVLPVAVALAARLLEGMFGSAPSLSATFIPEPALLHACIVLGLIYAAVYMLLMNRVRRASPLPFGYKPRRGDITIGTILWMGLACWLIFSVSGAQFLGGAVNRAIGVVTIEPGLVVAKRKSGGKGCYHPVRITSATVPDGKDVCLSLGDWNGLDVGDSLPVASIISGLGREVGLAPGAMLHVTKREP